MAFLSIFFSAKKTGKNPLIIHGAEYLVKSSDIIECKKFITNYGSINLAVKVRNEEGRIMECLILNYRGAKVCLSGNSNNLVGGSAVSGNWMKYAETYPLDVWSTNKK